MFQRQINKKKLQHSKTNKKPFEQIIYYNVRRLLFVNIQNISHVSFFPIIKELKVEVDIQILLTFTTPHFR